MAPQEISSELQILFDLFGARERSNPGSIFAATSGKPIDWPRLLALADRHLLYPQLSEAILEFGEAACPPFIFSAVREGRRQRMLVNRALETRLVEIFATNAPSVYPPIIAFKGPVLDQLLYDGRYLRQYSDLDILIHAEHVASFIVTLKSLGYEPEIPSADPIRDPIFLSRQEMSFERPGGMPTLLDLHWQLLPRFLPKCRSLQGFEQRTQMVNLIGYPVRTLSNQDLLVYLCHHTSKHCCESLAHLYEIANLCMRMPDTDWKELLAESRADGLHYSFVLGPYLAARLLGASVPGELLSEANRMPHKEKITELIAGAMELPCVPTPTIRRLYRVIWPSIGARAKRSAIEIFCPQPSDWEAFPLKSPWSYGYFILRPLRLLLRNAARTTRKLVERTGWQLR